MMFRIALKRGIAKSICEDVGSPLGQIFEIERIFRPLSTLGES
jgi:hypothetical protein